MNYSFPALSIKIPWAQNQTIADLRDERIACRHPTYVDTL